MKAKRVPFPLLAKVKTKQKRLEGDGIIEKIIRPIDWCVPIVPLKKKKNVHLWIDLKRLNHLFKREVYMISNLVSSSRIGYSIHSALCHIEAKSFVNYYMISNLEDIAIKLNGSMVFSKLDATRGFYQLLLGKHNCFKRLLLVSLYLFLHFVINS